MEKESEKGCQKDVNLVFSLLCPFKFSKNFINCRC
jgi:hypothetical protein